MFYMLYLQRHLDWFLKFLATRAVKQKLIQQNFEIYNKCWVSHGWRSYTVGVTKKNSRNRDTKIRPWRHGRMARAWTPESCAWTAAASWIFWTTSLFKKNPTYPGMSCSYPGISLHFYDPRMGLEPSSLSEVNYCHGTIVTDSRFTAFFEM